MTIIDEKTKSELEKFKSEVIAIAVLYEKYNRDNMLLINEITSRNDWRDLTAEAKDRKKRTAVNYVREEQDKILKSKIEKLRSAIDLYETKVTTDFIKEITGSEKLKQIALRMDLTPELCNLLLEDLALILRAVDMLESDDSVTDLILRKQLRNGGKGLSEIQKEAASERVNAQGSQVLSKYQTIKNILAGFKGQLVFVSDANIRYSPDDLTKISITNLVREGLGRTMNV